MTTGRQTTPEPYMKRNAATGFWPVRTPQEKCGPRQRRLPDAWHRGWTWTFRGRVYEVTFTQYRTSK